MIVEPSAQARQTAGIVFDQYVAFLQAGFDHEEAFRLTTFFMLASFDAEE